jgi:hypothetical protein
MNDAAAARGELIRYPENGLAISDEIEDDGYFDRPQL